MASKQSLKRAELAEPRIRDLLTGSMADSATVFHEEDGWVFSERPGKGITCIGRSAELPQPYLGRHHYPTG
jgi:hypothetical protein